MKQFFILGRNPELSRTEIQSYLKARNITYTEILFEKNVLILEIKNEKMLDIQELGGTLCSGTILFEGNTEALKKYLETEDVVPSEKFSYSIFGNANNDLLSNKFKQEKRKATYKPGTKRLHLQNGDTIHYSKTTYNFLNEEQKETTYFGVVEQWYDETEQEERDMNKPIRREALAIPPRLAKILINLAGIQPGETLADPFCGIGGILLEGLAQEMNVYGRDKDQQAISDAKQNLKWYKQNYKTTTRWNVETGDAKEMPEKKFEGIAGEGPLAKLMKNKPGRKEAEEIIQQYETKIIPILQRLKRSIKKGGRIALTYPAVRDKHVHAEKIAEETRMKLTIGPIHEYRDKQHINRDIIVYERTE